MITAAHQTMLAPQGAPLPYDAEVEYLYSDGTPYVDTGIIPTFPDDLTFKAGVSWPNVSTRKIMGRQGSFYIGCVNNGFQPGFGGNDIAAGITLSANTKYDVEARFVPTRINVADTVYYKVGTTEGSRSSYYLDSPAAGKIWIFAANNATTLRGPSSVYYFQIIRSGTTLRDYIPVRVGTTGYLYDRASGELFGNVGTGSFTVGPDKT